MGRRAKPHFGQNCTLNNDRLAQSFRVPFKPYLGQIDVFSVAVISSAILRASGVRELPLQPTRKISRANSLSNSNVCTTILRLPLWMRRDRVRDLVVVDWL